MRRNTIGTRKAHVPIIKQAPPRYSKGESSHESPDMTSTRKSRMRMTISSTCSPHLISVLPLPDTITDILEDAGKDARNIKLSEIGAKKY